MRRLRLTAVFFMVLAVITLASCASADKDEVFQKARDTFSGWEQYSLVTKWETMSEDEPRTIELHVHYDEALDERYVELYRVEEDERLLLLYLYAKDDAIYVFNDALHQGSDDEDEYRIELRSVAESDMPSAEEVIARALEAFPSTLEEVESTIRGDTFTYIAEHQDETWRVEGDKERITIETSEPHIGTVEIEPSDFLETFEGVDETRHIDGMIE